VTLVFSNICHNGSDPLIGSNKLLPAGQIEEIAILLTSHHPTFYLLHPFPEVLPETAGYLIYSCFAGIDAEVSAVVVAAASEVAEPVVVVVADISEHQVSVDIAVVF
jgi:hypothetical protein